MQKTTLDVDLHCTMAYVRSYLTLNIAYELITPNLLFLIKITPKLY